MERGFPRLLGDIGGTHARWAWQAQPGDAIGQVASYRSAAFESVLAVIRQYLAEHRLPVPARVAFGIATPITGDQVQMTNHPWRFSIAALQAALGVERLVVRNDFAMVAAALPTLAAADVRRIGGGEADPAAPVAVLGPGTGLGVAGMVRGADGRFASIAGEGGHVTLAATNDREDAVLAELRRRFGHVSAERAVSGPGLVNLYRAVCTIDGVAPRELRPAEVSARAQDGSDAACAEALRLFGGWLGNVAGNLALTLGARGGVYIGGGIVPRLGAAFDALPFRERFEAKGRFRDYLAPIPTAVITAPTIALRGAANVLALADT